MGGYSSTSLDLLVGAGRCWERNVLCCANSVHGGCLAGLSGFCCAPAVAVTTMLQGCEVSATKDLRVLTHVHSVVKCSGTSVRALCWSCASISTVSARQCSVSICVHTVGAFVLVPWGWHF
jgi:hypothetical protein